MIVRKDATGTKASDFQQFFFTVGTPGNAFELRCFSLVTCGALGFYPTSAATEHACCEIQTVSRSLRAAAPRVRSFAEGALKEIRLAEGNASLLSDQKAFSEFMYKVNER